MDLDPIDQLEREWQQLARGALAVRLHGWAEREPALRPFASARLLLRGLRAARGRHELENAILAALLRQARTDPLAGRVVLQALLPGLKNLAGRLLFEASERDEVWSLLLAHLWERIRCYPLERRPSRIAANLLLDTLRATTFELAKERDVQIRFVAEPPPAPAAAPGECGRGTDLALARAVAAGALSAQEAELILQTRIDGVELHELAAGQGLAYDTLKMRRIRAERRLRLFLGQPAVTSRARNRPLSSARADRDGLAGSAGGGAAHPPEPRR